MNQPDRQFDWVPVVDVVIVCAFFFLFHEQFLFSPGVLVDLPESRFAEVKGVATSAVLTVRRQNASGRNAGFFFQGKILTLEGLEGEFSSFSRRWKGQPGTLLVKADRRVSLEVILEICELARAAGFEGVQIASEGRETDARLFAESGGRAGREP